jgi:uncharacterized short protein YbdD (DUF466 family)
MRELGEKLVAGWRHLRHATGDDAYERYLAHHAAAHPGEPVLSRKEFFKREQERKWGGIRRCC